MANSKPIHTLAAFVDLERGKETGNSSSTLTSSSSMEHNEDYETGSHILSTPNNEDIEADPNGSNGLHADKDEAARTSTRATCQDMARAVTRISTKSSWKDPG